eukprot:3278221-Pleurochrysis_carterae.AAC.2
MRSCLEGFTSPHTFRAGLIQTVLCGGFLIKVARVRGSCFARLQPARGGPRAACALPAARPSWTTA